MINFENVITNKQHKRDFSAAMNRVVDSSHVTLTQMTQDFIWT